jgi:leader peptidase (prepilin peptidase) / N-methyltransferase
MGDVKLVAVMGLFLGSALAVAVSAAFAAGALAGGVLVLRDGLAARKRALPLAPFLALGGLVGLAAGHSIVDWYLARMIGA